MMTEDDRKEMADKVLALIRPETVVDRERFLSDWRVAGALIEKCYRTGHSILIASLPDGECLVTVHGPLTAPEYADPSRRRWAGQARDDEEARAIIDACTQALHRQSNE